MSPVTSAVVFEMPVDDFDGSLKEDRCYCLAQSANDVHKFKKVWNNFIFLFCLPHLCFADVGNFTFVGVSQRSSTCYFDNRTHASVCPYEDIRGCHCVLRFSNIFQLCGPLGSL